MTQDYIGKYVKKFESGSKGPLSLSSCGNDWGLSCGSYQLTLRWGNCINFLKKYFPQEAKALYFSAPHDVVTKYYPGSQYCSSPDAVKSVWMICYNKVGAEKFIEYETAHMKATYFDKLTDKVKPILDVVGMNDRAFLECFFSWPIHKGNTGSYNQFMEVIKEHGWEDLTYVDKEELFDAIYDKRYAVNQFNRYKKGLMNGASERETLRPLLIPGTVSGKIKEVEEKRVQDEYTKKIQDIISKVKKIDGIVKITYRGNDGINVREYPDFNSKVLEVITYGTEVNVIGITDDGKMYELYDHSWITASEKYVKFTQKKVNELITLYKIRIEADKVPFYKSFDKSSGIVGYVNKNQVFTIVGEENGFGRLKSGSGWICIDSSVKVMS